MYVHCGYYIEYIIFFKVKKVIVYIRTSYEINNLVVYKIELKLKIPIANNKLCAL